MFSCDTGISVSSLSLILLKMRAVTPLQREERRTTVSSSMVRLLLYLAFEDVSKFHVISLGVSPVSGMVLYFCDLFVYGFGRVFYKFNRDLVTSRTFAWLHFGYFFPNFICT